MRKERTPCKPAIQHPQPCFYRGGKIRSHRQSASLEFTQPVSGQAATCCHSLSAMLGYPSMLLSMPYHPDRSDFLFYQPLSQEHAFLTPES